MENITVGEYIKKIRLKRKMTQAELEHVSGVVQTHISLIEQDKRPVSIIVMKKLSGALNIPVEIFLYVNFRCELGGLSEQDDNQLAKIFQEFDEKCVHLLKHV